MKIYLAGSYREKTKLREYATRLKTFTTVTSHWLDQTEPDESEISEHLLANMLPKYAQRDLDDIDKSDYFLQISDKPNVRGGAHVEFGYALANHKIIIVIGTDHNVFHYLPYIYVFETFEQAFQFLKGENPNV